MQAFQIHQSLTEPQKFFFYEVFKDEAAFAEHQQSEHFKTLIAGQGCPSSPSASARSTASSNRPEF